MLLFSGDSGRGRTRSAAIQRRALMPICPLYGLSLQEKGGSFLNSSRVNRQGGSVEAVKARGLRLVL